jgi:hypothetical protein
MLLLAQTIAATLRWFFKGCKTKLSDEIHGKLPPTWGSSYDAENMIIGIIVSIIFLGVIFGLLIITKTI